MDEFFDNKRAPEASRVEGFSIELIRRYGIRTAELGNYSMGYDLKTPEQKAEGLQCRPLPPSTAATDAGAHGLCASPP